MASDSLRNLIEDYKVGCLTKMIDTNSGAELLAMR